MLDRKKTSIKWIDGVWILFILTLVFLPPINEIHKQIILFVIGAYQLVESHIIARLPARGHIYSVIIKISLATLLLDHTGGVGINSDYYPIYYLPVVTAAMYFGPLGTLLWTAITSLAYCSLLIPVLNDYEIPTEGYYILAIRIIFFFVAGLLVNQFAVENRRQAAVQADLLKALEETNRQLRRAEADARRSERLAALGQLSAGLAHEIRNPLGVIKGSAEMLTQKLKDSQPLASELAGYIYSEVNRLNALVARFLDFARPQHLDLRAQQVSAIVDRALEAAQSQFPEAGVKVERHYTPHLPDVLLDEQLCESVFTNLIVNAFQAMTDPPGPVPPELTITASQIESNGRLGVSVTVEDNGSGVPPELREQIFNPFFTSKKSGVGLGLSIVAKIVDDHRGSIRLESASPHGARFSVFLPFDPNA